MTMKPTYIYDGSFEGLLCAVAAAVKSNISPEKISDRENYLPGLYDRITHVAPDPAQAQRLFSYLTTLGRNPLRLVINGFLSEDPQIGMHIYYFVRYSLARGTGAASDITHDSIAHLHKTARKVSFEAHRFTGLIRFRILEDGLQYAPFEPDHNILGYLAKHFSKRLQNRRWILHDVRRKTGAYWDGSSLHEAAVDHDFTSHVTKTGEIPDSQLTETEKYYQGLWKSFHNQISNPNRKNLNLQRQHMPKRYWKYLTEL